MSRGYVDFVEGQAGDRLFFGFSRETTTTLTQGGLEAQLGNAKERDCADAYPVEVGEHSAGCN